MTCINFRSRWCTSQVKLSMLMDEAWHYFVPFPKSQLYRHNTHMEYTYHYRRVTCPRSQTKRTPPFDKHALWHDRTGYGLAWEPHPLPPPASFLGCGELPSLTSRFLGACCTLTLGGQRCGVCLTPPHSSCVMLTGRSS